MPNIAATVAALETYCGFPAARTRQVARRLLEDKILTPGAPGVAVEISEADFVALLLGVTSGASMPRVTGVVAALTECVPDGDDVEVMPLRLRPPVRTAFDILHDLVWNAAHGDGRMAADVEIVENFHEVTFHTPSGAVRCMPAGTLAGRWQVSTQRRSTRIPASALFLAARNLFGDKP